jgi:allophanate hydrolase
VFAPAQQDGPLLRLAARLQRALAAPLGATGLLLPAPATTPRLPGGQVRIAVCGAHLAGLPLNGQLTSRGGRLIATTQSAPQYKFYALPGGPPQKPGMVRVTQGGSAVALEVWELPLIEFGSFVAGISAPLGIGTVTLADGSEVLGFVCEAAAVEGAEDITAFGGWRAYLASPR